MWTGDVRRVRRLVALAYACLGAPDQALPNKLHDPGGSQGALRLLRSPHVTHPAVLDPHPGPGRGPYGHGPRGPRHHGPGLLRAPDPGPTTRTHW
ncbi:transposase DNA-binding-containing protein [Gemmata massiliana]|uniref:transposase DNA-binding-containing protein n=1 Tax=Gemmata massiliana TaxID=1210884 RepID=UPI0013A6A0DF